MASLFKATAVASAIITGEELILVIRALERSSRSFEYLETLRSHGIRVSREAKLADVLRRAIERSL